MDDILAHERSAPARGNARSEWLNAVEKLVAKHPERKPKFETDSHIEIDRLYEPDKSFDLDAKLEHDADFLTPGSDAHTHDHEHDQAISSVGITEDRPVDGEKLNEWMSRLLRDKGQDIFRMKGILNVKGAAKRFVFQGVHMQFEGKSDREWRADEVRRSTLVFIGRNLDRQALNADFKQCLA